MLGGEPEECRPPPTAVVTVAVVVVVRKGRVLVGQRSMAGPLPGLAEFPGGKCLPGETPEQCALRECQEETGLMIRLRGRLEELEHTYPHGRLRLVFFLAEPLNDAEPVPPFTWHPVADLPHLPFPEANRSVIQWLVERSPW